MPFDALTIASVRDELEQRIIGGRVQGVLVPGPLTISLEIYRSGFGRSHLLLSAHPQHARVHLLQKSPSRDAQQKPTLLLLLRKYVRGGTIIDISQPPNERVLAISIAKSRGAGKRQEYRSDPYFRGEGEEKQTIDDGRTMDDGRWTMDDGQPASIVHRPSSIVRLLEDQADEDDEDDDTGDMDDAEVTTVELVVEIMGKLSNIILVGEDGAVMDSIKRVPSSINRYRVVLPNHRYTPPPPQDKRDPAQATINVLSLELSKTAEQDASAPAWKGLVNGFSGISPTLAREVAFRVLGDGNASILEVVPAPARLESILHELQVLLNLGATGGWEPSIAWKESAHGELTALDFAPIPLRHLEAGGATLEKHASISEAVTRYFDALQTLGGHSAFKAQIRNELAEMRGREERKLYALSEQLERSEASEELRRKGEYLLAYMHTLKPGQHTLNLSDENLKIELDPALTPVENAQAFFREYHKARSAQEGLPALVEQVEMRVSYLDELITSLDLAVTYDDIRAVQSEVKFAGAPAGTLVDGKPADVNLSPNTQAKAKGRGGKSQEKEKVPQPLRSQTSRGAQLLIGRAARQNDVATFRLAAPDDLWFHARGVPGSHVILRTGGAPISPQDIEEAASYAAAYSRAREEAQVDVIYTEKRYVRKVPNSPPGFVTYKNERVVRVKPRVRE